MSGYGMAGHLMCQFQNSYGTQLTSSLSAIPIISEGFKYTIEQLQEAGMYGRFGESPVHTGKMAVAGAISMETEPSAMGWFLKAVLGGWSVVSGTGIQTHTFIPVIPTSEFDDRAAVRPMTFEINRDVGSAGIYYDCLGNDLAISVANGQLLTMNVNFLGAGFAKKSAGTPVFPSGKPFLWDQFSGSYNGAAVVDLMDFNVSFNNNLSQFWTLTGSKCPYRIKRTGHQKCEVSGKFVFAAHSYWQAFADQVEQSLVLHFTNAASPHKFTMDFSKLRFKTFDVNIGGAGLIEASFAASALFDTASNRACTFTLVNTQTYY